MFFVFTEEPFATLIAILGLIGIAHRLLHRDCLLPLWMAILFFVEGRSAAGPASIPLAMLAAIGLVDVVLAAMQPKGANEAEQSDHVTTIERNVFIYVSKTLRVDEDFEAIYETEGVIIFGKQ